MTKIPYNPKESFIQNEKDLILNIDKYYDLSIKVLRDFGGPSIYFHTQSIKEQKKYFLSDRHIEMIYATLASWGMHRMGDPRDTKAKLVEYSDFRKSILANNVILKEAQSLRMDSCDYEQYQQYLEDLKDVYFSLKVSISDSTIVAHSKTLAHILPNLIPPIDRQYTIRFFTQDNKIFFTNSGEYKSVNLPNTIEQQYKAFKNYSCRMKALLDRCDCRLFKLDGNSFNTSYPKIIDNLIMAYVKNVPKPKKK